MPDVTVILLNYKRPQNLSVIIDALRSQTEMPEIWLIDNSEHWQYRCPIVQPDRYAYITWNGGCFARLLMAAYVQTPYVCFLSDDLCPADDEFIADLLEASRQQQAAMVGTDGHGLNREPPYYDKYDNRQGWVPILKGTCLCFLRAVLDDVHLARPLLRREPDYLRRCDDLYLSLEVGRGQAVHWADSGLQKRLRQMPGAEMGLCQEPGHYRMRDKFCRDYIKDCL